MPVASAHRTPSSNAGGGASTPNTTSAVPTLDTIHHYLGYGVHPSRCRVRVFAPPRPDELPADFCPAALVVVLTELPDNPGTSVTNAVETIASELMPSLVESEGLRDRVIWIEHYPSRCTGPGTARGKGGAIAESFALVRFEHFDDVGSHYGRKAWGKGFSGPRWCRIGRDQLERLIGGSFEGGAV